MGSSTVVKLSQSSPFCTFDRASKRTTSAFDKQRKGVVASRIVHRVAEWQVLCCEKLKGSKICSFKSSGVGIVYESLPLATGHQIHDGTGKLFSFDHEFIDRDEKRY